MSRVCEITKKKPMAGHNVSHSEIKTKRRFLPNLQVVSFLSEVLGTKVTMKKLIKKPENIENLFDGANKFSMRAN